MRCLYLVSVLLIFSAFCVVIVCAFIYWVPCCDIRYDFHIETMFVSSLSPIGGLMSYVCYSCFFANSFVQHILCFVFLRLVNLMLPVSLDCPFLIVPSLFSNVYFLYRNSKFRNEYRSPITTLVTYFRLLQWKTNIPRKT